MWIMIWEVVVFSILLALILGYFWGFWLGVNRDVHIDSVVHVKMKEMQKEKQKKEKTNDKFDYKVDRVIYYDNKTHQYFKEYKITLTDQKKKPLPKDKFNQIVNSIFYSWDNNLYDVSGNCIVYSQIWKFVSFNKKFWFNKKNDVTWNGEVGTVARYHNVWTYSWEKLDLLVKVVKLKNLNRLYISSTTPKWFKATTLNGKWAVGFFLNSSRKDVVWTDYSVTLNFTFVKAWTNKPINTNFDVLINDIDNTYNRKEKIIIPHNSYEMYKVSNSSFVYGINNKSNDEFFDILKYVPVNYSFDIKNGKIRFWDFKSTDINAMLEIFYKNKSSFDITFSAVKKVDIGKSFGKAGFLISFWNNLLTWCNNFYKVNPSFESNFVDQKLFNNMLIYGWDLSNISNPVNYFGKYKVVVFSWIKLEKNNFNTFYKIVHSLSWNTVFMWTIKISDIINPFRNALYQINLWKDVGAEWIILKGLDENTWVDNNYTKAQYNTLIKSLVLYASSLWLKVMGDSYLIDQGLFDNLDGVIIPYNYSNWNNIEPYTKSILSKLSWYKGNIMCYSTIWSLDMDNIYEKIGVKMNEDCVYRTIQSDFVNPITYNK